MGVSATLLFLVSVSSLFRPNLAGLASSAPSPLPSSLAVSGPPTAIAVGATATLTCRAYGTPTPLIVGWLHEREMITQGGRYSLKLASSYQILQIWGVNKKDAGSYECLAIAGGRNMSESYAVRILEPPIIFNVSNTTVAIEGRDATLRCLSEGRLFTRWLFNGTYVDYLRRYKIIDMGSEMVIQNVTEKDEGIYTCEVYNQRFQTNAQIRLVVNYPPKFLSQPKNTVVLAGSSVVLRCIGKARPTAKVIWLHNSKMVSQDTRVLQETDELLLTNLHTGDAGAYQCIMRNAIGTRLSQTATLTILDNTLTVPAQQNVTAIYGHSVIFSCDHYPNQWTKNLAVVDFEYDKGMELLHNHSLQLDDVTYSSERDTFSCLYSDPSNSNAMTMRNFFITVNQPSQAPVNITVSILPREQLLRISWSQPPTDFPVLSYTVYIKSVANNTSLQFTAASTETSVKIMSLETNASYYLIIEAVTAVGKYPSKPMEFIYTVVAGHEQNTFTSSVPRSASPTPWIIFNADNQDRHGGDNQDPHGNTQDNTGPQSDHTNVGLILGCSFAATAAIITLLLLYLYYRRKHQHSKMHRLQ